MLCTYSLILLFFMCKRWLCQSILFSDDFRPFEINESSSSFSVYLLTFSKKKWGKVCNLHQWLFSTCFDLIFLCSPPMFVTMRTNCLFLPSSIITVSFGDGVIHISLYKHFTIKVCESNQKIFVPTVKTEVFPYYFLHKMFNLFIFLFIICLFFERNPSKMFILSFTNCFINNFRIQLLIIIKNFISLTYHLIEKIRKLNWKENSWRKRSRIFHDY